MTVVEVTVFVPGPGQRDWDSGDRPVSLDSDSDSRAESGVFTDSARTRSLPQWRCRGCRRRAAARVPEPRRARAAGLRAASRRRCAGSRGGTRHTPTPTRRSDGDHLLARPFVPGTALLFGEGE